uniref:TTF-type domain-containing protein n=1 Tax=Neogobius melanostomus TaxID=47308 RepID=A0A8C6WW11_9GOBI
MNERRERELTTFVAKKIPKKTSTKRNYPSGATKRKKQLASKKADVFTSKSDVIFQRTIHWRHRWTAAKQCVLDDDPASWPKEVTDDQRCSLVRRGPVQVKQHFPKNAEGCRFTCNNYQMQMRNGEKVNRSWLVYTVRKDAVFCFCCRLFADKEKRSQLSGDGFNSWKNLAAHLKQHEKSAEHMDNMDTWLTLSQRLKTCTAIDQVNQNLISLEVNCWKEVLRRLLAIVNHLAEHNLPGNGNFLGQVQLMAQFDPIMQEHLRRVQAKEISDTYLSKHIQNELISLVAQCTINAIVERVKTAKYYAVIMDCTPDLSHNEQLSVVLRIVNCEPPKGVSIHEHFVGFLLAPDTTGKGLCDLFLGHLDTLSLDLTNCRGQAYDNGSNMQGKKQGVQRRVLELNNKALFVPCGSHTLNLVVGDAAKSSVRSISFFCLLQRLYTLISSSVNRWAILRKHVKDLSVKALSTTRWECRVEAVKAVRYQLPEILSALSELTDYAMEKRDAEVVSTARGICQEMQRLPFLVSTIVWYNVLFQINKVSKILQSPNVSVETVRKEITAVTEFLQDFREHGFNAAIADGTEVEMSWPEVRRRVKKNQFEYEGREQTQQTAEELFKTEFFLHLIDTALVTMLNHIYKENVLDVYPNLSIALRLLLTLPVTVASGERSFSALKLIKTYLRTTMSQERLSALALLSIEQKVWKTLDMESVIARFAEAKARKVRF